MICEIYEICIGLFNILWLILEMIVALEQERIQGTGLMLANEQGTGTKRTWHRVIHPVF